MTVTEGSQWFRVAFGGDWPVVLHASAYRSWVDTVDTLLADMAISDAARAKIWAENARRFYRPAMALTRSE